MATAAVSHPRGNAEVGKAQRLFAEQAAAGARELMESGQCKPYTIVNFNPVPVGLQGELKRYKVWTPDDGALPEGVCRLELPYGENLHKGHVLTIREPHKYGKIVGAANAGAPGEVIAQREVKFIIPMGIGYSFLEHYSPVFVAKPGTILPPAPKDARKIFGLLVFEGDIRTLEALLDETDPAKRIIRVPVAHVMTVGETSIKTFRSVEYQLDEYLEKMFTGQRRFADATVARAQQKWSETQTIADISDVDRVWYRWMIDKGFAKRPAAGEKTWLNEYLVLSDAEKGAGNLRKCQACRTPEPEAETPFCPKCNSPINTFTTFMAGYPVSDSWLMALKGEERELALAEMKLRKQGFGEEPAARGPYKGKGKKGEAAIDPATEEIPPADTTALAGEE